MSYAQEKKFNDRGLLVSRRSMRVVMILIDTNSGALLWSGYRYSAQSASKLISSTTLENFLDYPAWDLLFEEIFREDLWKEFPGRIFNN